MEETQQRRQQTTTTNNLSTFLQEMVDDQREFQMNVGRAMDVLRNDYPYFLKRAPGEFFSGVSSFIEY